MIDNTRGKMRPLRTTTLISKRWKALRKTRAGRTSWTTWKRTFDFTYLSAEILTFYYRDYGKKPELDQYEGEGLDDEEE